MQQTVGSGYVMEQSFPPAKACSVALAIELINAVTSNLERKLGDAGGILTPAFDGY